MKRKMVWLALAMLLLLGASFTGALPAGAQTAATWTGFYYPNVNLQGDAAFTRGEPYIDFVWGSYSPVNGIPNGGFSIRWIRWLFMNQTGAWQFTTITKDGARLFVDDQLVMDAWYAQPTSAHSVTLNLTQGFHLVRMEYFNNGGTAEAHFAMQYIAPAPAPQPVGPVWHGEYYNGMDLAGMPALFRDDANLNFNWGGNSPGLGIAQGINWSARWRITQNTPTTGYYTVSATADDGVRVWVDNNLLINQWKDQPPTTYLAVAYLTAGMHDWRVEYYQHLGGSMIAVTITPGGNPGPVPPPPGPQPGPQPFDLAIDTRSAYFQKGGTGNGWQPVANGYGGTAFWTMNNSYAQSRYNWARWYVPPTRACYYQVSVYIPAGYATTRNARYWVYHAGKYEARTVNQAASGGQWVSLGTFNFNGTGGEYVSLSDVTYEPFLSSRIIFDSVNFAPRCL